jgi:hypothetical protein
VQLRELSLGGFPLRPEMDGGVGHSGELAALQTLGQHVAVAGLAGRAADASQCSLQPFTSPPRQDRFKEPEGRRSPARPDAELVDRLGIAGVVAGNLGRLLQEVLNGSEA